MSDARSTGICAFCNETFSRQSMARHIAQCLAQKHDAAANTSEHFQILVQGLHAKDYWMHIAAPATSPLSRLDKFLRKTWLECCGHLSSFKIAGNTYSVDPEPGYQETDMSPRLNQVLHAGLEFMHSYDYGDTTELKLKVIAPIQLPSKRGAVQLLARNTIPQRQCQTCNAALATQVCPQCMYEDAGWLCNSCANSHDCGCDSYLPVVNSPRTGVCAYQG